MGGCNGTSMVSTVEVFDPRIGSWMAEESMKDPRGFFAAIVSGGKIYVIGGLDHNSTILETIESYDEGSGWQVTNLKAVGKRGFFSALVL
ncbi:unnamed protein product [Ilex paraguariensis]